MSGAYYNEIDRNMAAWLRELIRRNLIASGEVDERSIEDVRPSDLRGFTQCHFFAGIGVWSYALRLAEWPDDRPVWTGSCPCQPFSQAGKGVGFADERHLWPAWFHLVQQCRPAVVFGEQVASPDGLAWLNLVQADMEGQGYAIGASDLCAAGVGAPFCGQRLYWMAAANRGGRTSVAQPHVRAKVRVETPRRDYVDGRRAHAWSSAREVVGFDGRSRILEPGIKSMVDGAPAILVRLRGYGNAINAEIAAEFIRAADECLSETRVREEAHAA